MNADNTSQDMNKYLFVNLVTMLSVTTMQQLGKIINPAAGKAEINLDAAQATIDTLDMLAARTKGNLDNDEARFLKDTLSTLKMNYVETREEEQKNKARPPQAEQKSREKPGPQPAAGEQPKDPKFHKSYE